MNHYKYIIFATWCTAQLITSKLKTLTNPATSVSSFGRTIRIALSAPDSGYDKSLTVSRWGVTVKGPTANSTSWVRQSSN